MPQVAIVTDSTAYLPGELASALGVITVPVHVVVGGATYDEGVDIAPSEVAAALREWVIVTTSRPTPERFGEAYTAAAETGALEVVSIHLSGDMSGTYESAVVAARTSPIPVHVIDSRTVAMALGFGVLSAAEAAARGDSGEEVAMIASNRCTASSALFYVDTLDFLRRGGRIGAAQALLGQALAVKPILTVVDGKVSPLEKVRTASRALARLEELALQRAAGHDVDIAVHHLDALDRAQALAERMAVRLPDAQVIVSEVGAVVGSHVGPGMVAVVVAPR
jgi:DegV family protein with EDD domain